MALNPEFVGRVYGPGEPYEVSRVKIADFADAIGEPSELCRDAEAARQAGLSGCDRTADLRGGDRAWPRTGWQRDPGLGLDYSMVVHGEQSFSYSRPLHAGDVVVATTTIESIKARRRPVDAGDVHRHRPPVDGEHVCTARSTLVERGAKR